MDTIDRRLISELQINGRASVPQLAELLGVARATAQKRLDRLITDGTIKGFTVKVRDNAHDELIRAFMLIELSANNIKGTIASIKRMPGLAMVSNTNGIWDMIAEVEVATINELNDVISKIRAQEGVTKSETFIILGPA